MALSIVVQLMVLLCVSFSALRFARRSLQLLAQELP